MDFGVPACPPGYCGTLSMSVNHSCAATAEHARICRTLFPAHVYWVSVAAFVKAVGAHALCFLQDADQ
jgi:hypothetical protein